MLGGMALRENVQKEDGRFGETAYYGSEKDIRIRSPRKLRVIFLPGGIGPEVLILPGLLLRTQFVSLLARGFDEMHIQPCHKFITHRYEIIFVPWEVQGNE